MPLIISPRQFVQRAEFYHQLSQLTSAGIPIVRALEQIKRSPPAPSFREPLQRLLDELANQSGGVNSATIARLQEEMNADGLLFQVRVLRSRIPEQEAGARSKEGKI